MAQSSLNDTKKELLLVIQTKFAGLGLNLETVPQTLLSSACEDGLSNLCSFIVANDPKFDFKENASKVLELYESIQLYRALPNKLSYGAEPLTALPDIMPPVNKKELPAWARNLSIHMGVFYATIGWLLVDEPVRAVFVAAYNDSVALSLTVKGKRGSFLDGLNKTEDPVTLASKIVAVGGNNIVINKYKNFTALTGVKITVIDEGDQEHSFVISRSKQLADPYAYFLNKRGISAATLTSSLELLLNNFKSGSVAVSTLGKSGTINKETVSPVVPKSGTIEEADTLEAEVAEKLDLHFIDSNDPARHGGKTVVPQSTMADALYSAFEVAPFPNSIPINGSNWTTLFPWSASPVTRIMRIAIDTFNYLNRKCSQNYDSNIYVLATYCGLLLNICKDALRSVGFDTLYDFASSRVELSAVSSSVKVEHLFNVKVNDAMLYYMYHTLEKMTPYKALVKAATTDGKDYIRLPLGYNFLDDYLTFRAFEVEPDAGFLSRAGNAVRNTALGGSKYLYQSIISGKPLSKDSPWHEVYNKAYVVLKNVFNISNNQAFCAVNNMVKDDESRFTNYLAYSMQINEGYNELFTFYCTGLEGFESGVINLNPDYSTSTGVVLTSSKVWMPLMNNKVPISIKDGRVYGMNLTDFQLPRVTWFSTWFGNLRVEYNAVYDVITTRKSEPVDMNKGYTIFEGEANGAPVQLPKVKQEVVTSTNLGPGMSSSDSDIGVPQSSYQAPRTRVPVVGKMGISK